LVFRDLGQQRLKGLDRPVRIYQVVAPDLRRAFPPVRSGEEAGRSARRRWLALALAALAVAAGLAVAVVLLTGGGEPAVAVPVPPNSLAEIDPARNVPVRVVQVGRNPGSVVATSEAVWVVNEGDRTLTRYDPREDHTITVGGVRLGPGARIASDGRGGVWVTTGGPEVAHVNADGDVVPEDSIRVPEGGTTAVATGGGWLWVTTPSDLGTSGRNTVAQISLKTKKPVKTWVVGDIPLFLAYGAGSVWVANLHGNNVSVLTPGLPVRTIEIGGRPLGLTVSEGALWVGDYDEQKISKIDASTLRPEAILPIGLGYLGVAADASSVWVTNRNDGTLTRIDPRPGHERVVATVKLGNCPQEVATGAGGVWVTMRSDQECY
jgi:streptogramin lyase